MDFDPEQDPTLEEQETLRSRLSEADWEQVQDVFRDISGQIRWGRVLEDFWAGLLERAECLAWGEGPYEQPGRHGNGVYKDYPWVMVPPDIQAYFEDHSEDKEGLKSQHKRHLLQLFIARKVLGGLRTKVRQAIENMPTQLLEMEAPEGPAAPESLPMGAGPHLRPCANGSLHHVRTKSVRVLDGDLYFLDTYCRDCNQTIARKPIGGRQMGPSNPRGKVRGLIESRVLDLRKPEKTECPCNRAQWVKGKEGKEAICSFCGEPIRNPETFHWQEAGLEPFGDDPSQDEVIELCSEYSS